MSRSNQKGVAIVEFALILPMLLVMSFMTTEIGRALYQYNSITKSVRDAARYLSTQTPGTHQAEAQNLIVYGNIAGTGDPVAPGLSTTNVSPPVWEAQGTGPVINTVTVRVTGYSFRSIFSSAFGHTFGTIPYSDITATMRSYL
jgi:Flp pilus assembly protein TadG